MLQNFRGKDREIIAAEISKKKYINNMLRCPSYLNIIRAIGIDHSSFETVSRLILSSGYWHAPYFLFD
jgi:hypothetical protein